jgi:hypothetical protein
MAVGKVSLIAMASLADSEAGDQGTQFKAATAILAPERDSDPDGEVLFKPSI